MSNVPKPAEAERPRLGKASTLARLALIGAALVAVAGTFAYLGGWLSDHVPERRIVLAAGYGLAVIVALLLISQPKTVPLLALTFAIAGVVVGVVEALEDSLAADLVLRDQHGMAFGTLAAVNAVGDFASSAVVGLLWSAASPSAAFGFSAGLFALGAVLILRSR